MFLLVYLLLSLLVCHHENEKKNEMKMRLQCHFSASVYLLGLAIE